MDQDKATELLEKYHAGTCTEAEKAAVEAWYNFQGLSTKHEIVEEDLELRKELIWNSIGSNTGKVVKLNVWKYAGIAAAVAAIVFGVWLYTSRHLEGSAATRDLLTNTNDIAPGGNKATLSVNGKTIQLSEDKTGVIVGNDLKYNDGTALGSFANNEGAIKNITASTPRGGMYQITLPDGTRAWMNADTKISFPAQFIGNERKILLSGEAYFEVAKNKEKPFIVESEGQKVEVLGTHFNISAYKGEGIKTTLLEGSVKVMQRNSGLALPGTTLPNNEGVVLKPNQQALVTGSQGISVKQVDAEEVIAWKAGYFGFSNETLESVMNKVSRWYDVQVVFADEAVKQKIILGSVSRYENLSKVIRVLERLEVAEFKIEGKTITIDKKK